MVNETPLENASSLENEDFSLQIGDTVKVTGTGGNTLRVRMMPTLSSEVVTGFPSGTILLIIDGPKTADNYTWWKIRSEDSKEGWCVGDYLVVIN